MRPYSRISQFVLLSPEELEKLLSKTDLTGIVNWSIQEQKEVRDLITEFGFLFVLDDLDLGKDLSS